MIGLIGAHRTGKTTLARTYAEKVGGFFLETPTSQIFSELGLDPAGQFSFSERLDVQEIILRRLDDLYATAPLGTPVITDRTPVDMLGYTTAEAIGYAVSDEDQTRFAKYTRDCYDVLNKRFSAVMLVQPGLPIVLAPGKAAPNAAYMEHLNSLMFGLMVDPRTTVPHFYMERHRFELEDRILALESVAHKSFSQTMGKLAEYVSTGLQRH